MVTTGWFGLAQAQVVITLKNGRQITVEDYREDGATIKFYGFGGEIGLGKEQIQSIDRVRSGAPQGLNVRASEAPAPPSGSDTAVPGGEPSAIERAPTRQEEERAREEKEYQEKLIEITQRLREARDRYSAALRGTTSPDATQLVTEDQIRARGDDVTSRFKDALRNPSEPAPVNLLRPSPFTSLPPAVESAVAGQSAPSLGTPEPYTDREKAFSQLREETIKLEKEREKLINEMRQKNLGAGSMFAE